MKKHRIWIAIGIVAALVMIAGAVCVEQYYRLEVCNFISKDGKGHGYYVYPGASADSLLIEMEKDYQIGNKWDFRLHARHWLYKHPKTGYYHFPAKIGDRHLIRRLQLGEQTPVRLTFTKNVRTRAQLAGVLASYLLLDSVDVIARLDSAAYMRQFDLTPQTAVCMFIPNTYEVYWTISADQLFSRMSKEYRRFWNAERRNKAQQIGLNPVEVSTLASIIESETNRMEEYPTIASVYLNRIRKGIPLQACPTVIFAVGDFNMRRVLNRHLRIDSPYNTYKYPGLPPGPIRLARGEAMDAVLNAPKTDYLYMCANPDFTGSHIFSSSFRQHSSVAHKYQRALNERKIKG